VSNNVVKNSRNANTKRKLKLEFLSLMEQAILTGSVDELAHNSRGGLPSSSSFEALS